MAKSRLVLWSFLMILGVSSVIRSGINFERAATIGPFMEKVILAVVWLGLGVVLIIFSQRTCSRPR